MFQTKFLPSVDIPKLWKASDTSDYQASVYELRLLCLLSLSVVIVFAANFGAMRQAWAQSANPHAVSLYNLGLTAYKQGSPESAIIFFKRAADIDPDLADAQYNLGVLYQSEHRLKEAIPRFQEVLRVKPQDQDAHFQLGLALIDLGRLPEARQHLLAIAPNSQHFSEAQKKVAMIDAQGPQTSLAAPSNSSAPQAGEESSSNLNRSASSPATPATSAPSTAYVGETYPDRAAASPATSFLSPTTHAAAAGAAQVNPISVLANSSVHVIATGFSAPAGLAFDKQGNLYVANFLTNAIDRITSDGIRSPFVSGVNLKGPIGLAADGDGNLYVANYLGGTITRINPAGIASVIATGFKKPYYLTVDREGNLFVSQQEDNSVVRITLPKTIGARSH